MKLLSDVFEEKETIELPWGKLEKCFLLRIYLQEASLDDCWRPTCMREA